MILTEAKNLSDTRAHAVMPSAAFPIDASCSLKVGLSNASPPPPPPLGVVIPPDARWFRPLPTLEPTLFDDVASATTPRALFCFSDGSSVPAISQLSLIDALFGPDFVPLPRYKREEISACRCCCAVSRLLSLELVGPAVAELSLVIRRP